MVGRAGAGPGRVAYQDLQRTTQGETSRARGAFSGVNAVRNGMAMPMSNGSSLVPSASQQRLSASAHSLMAYLNNNPPQAEASMPATLPASTRYTNQSNASSGASPTRALSSVEKNARAILSRVRDHDSGGKELQLLRIMEKSGEMKGVRQQLTKDANTLAFKLETKASQQRDKLQNSLENMSSQEVKAASFEIDRLNARAKALKDFAEALQ